MQRFVTSSALAALVVLLTACSSSGHRTVVDPTNPTTTTPVASSSARDSLEFRPVLEAVPYKGVPQQSATNACERAVRAMPDDQAKEAARKILADRTKTACYLLGPTILTGPNIAGAEAIVDPTSSEWTVNLRFANDDFVTKVARPDVGKQIAIVFDGVVQSAPTVNMGITGRDVTISGQFDEATARAIARRLS
jgi:preprotein translocase subunit SecD